MEGSEYGHAKESVIFNLVLKIQRLNNGVERDMFGNSYVGGSRRNMTADRCNREISDEYVVPFAGFFNDGFILKQDNARAHHTRSVSYGYI